MDLAAPVNLGNRSLGLGRICTFLMLDLMFLFLFLCLGERSLAEKVASVIGCTVIAMEDYRDSIDDGNELETLDFDALVQNLEVNVLIPASALFSRRFLVL